MRRDHRRSRARDNGNGVPPSGTRRTGGSTGIPSQREYEDREFREFQNKLREVERAPLAERKESCREFFEAMKDSPDTVAERVGWLIDGSYGYGAHVQARRIADNPRMNRVAALTQMVGALEWSCPGAMTIAAWKRLSKDEQETLRREVQAEIDSYVKEQAAERGRDAYPSTPAGARAYKDRIEAMMRKYPGDGGRSSSKRSSRSKSRGRDAMNPPWVVKDLDRGGRVIARHDLRKDARDDAMDRNRRERRTRYGYGPSYPTHEGY